MKQRRWLARASFALMLAAAAVLIGFADLASLAMVGLGAIGVCLILAGGYWFLANRGVLRWLALALVIARADRSSWSCSRCTTCCGSPSWRSR